MKPDQPTQDLLIKQLLKESQPQAPKNLSNNIMQQIMQQEKESISVKTSAFQTKWIWKGMAATIVLFICGIGAIYLFQQYFTFTIQSSETTFSIVLITVVAIGGAFFFLKELSDYLLTIHHRRMHQG